MPHPYKSDAERLAVLEQVQKHHEQRFVGFDGHIKDLNSNIKSLTATLQSLITNDAFNQGERKGKTAFLALGSSSFGGGLVALIHHFWP